MAIRGSLKWYGNSQLKALEQALDIRLLAAGEYARSKIVRNISTGTASHGPSKKGEYPHADTGTLRKSIVVQQVVKGEVRVGTSVKYAAYLEFGGRSFLRRTIIEEAARIGAIIGKSAG